MYTAKNFKKDGVNTAFFDDYNDSQDTTLFIGRFTLVKKSRPW